MQELAGVFYELKGIFGPAVAIGIAVGVYLWSQRNNRDKADADSVGQIHAIAVYQQLLETERAARIQGDQRADLFAQERNKAYEQVWEMKGQLKAMNELIATQNLELVALREQLQILREQIHAQQQ